MTIAKGPWKPRVTPLRIIDPIRWAGETVPERRWTVDRLVPRGAVTMLGGDGGVGKSLLAMQLLTAAAIGKPWLGTAVTHCRALGVFCEDDPAELHIRQSRICEAMGADLGDLENLQLISRVGEDNVLMSVDRYNKPAGASPFFVQLLEQAKAFGAELLVLDSLHDLFAGNENSRPEARQFINLLRQIALEIDGAVVLCAHPSMSGLQSGSGNSGSTAWNNAVRSRLYLTRPNDDNAEQDPDSRILKTMKANYGRMGSILELRYEDGVFVRTDQPAGLFANIARKRAEEAFLECLDATLQQGRHVTEVSNSPRFAPRVFAKMPEADRASVKDLERAMQALFSGRKIRIDNVKGSDRHPIKAIVRQEIAHE